MKIMQFCVLTQSIIDSRHVNLNFLEKILLRDFIIAVQWIENWFTPQHKEAIVTEWTHIQVHFKLQLKQLILWT